MVKPKRRQLAAIAANKGNTLAGLIDSSNSSSEDSWVIVKKQRITILVPPLSVAQQSIVQIPGTGQVRTKSRIAVKSRSYAPLAPHPQECSRDEWKRSATLSSKDDIRTGGGIPSSQPDSTLEKLSRPTCRMVSECPDQVATESGLPPPSLNLIDGHVLGTRISWKRVGITGASKAIKRARLPPYICAKGSSLFHGSISCLDGGVLLNQRMRALNLERKLKRAGGLSRWLVSLGLGQFIQMFKRKRVSKFQLVNLTMSKLKDMGAEAVGPRRKLIHAINCLSPHYYF